MNQILLWQKNVSIAKNFSQFNKNFNIASIKKEICLVFGIDNKNLEIWKFDYYISIKL